MVRRLWASAKYGLWAFRIHLDTQLTLRRLDRKLPPTSTTGKS